MAIELTKYSFTKEQFSAASKDEQHLFLLTGHLLVEINILTRLLTWSSTPEIGGEPFAAGVTANTLISLMYYMSKLYEGWQLVRERFTPKIQALYLPKFSEAHRHCYADLDEYFNGQGRSSIEKVRNNLGFHNHDEFGLLLAALNKHPDPVFHIYMHDAPGMCLFDISEQVIGYCLGRIVNNSIDDIEKYKSALMQLTSETTTMSVKLQDVLLAFQANFIQQYIQGKAKVTKISINPASRFEDVRFPYFTQLPMQVSESK